MIRRTSMYDRISEQRLAREALEKQQADQALAEAEALALAPIVVPVVPMTESPSSFNFGGFNFAFPGCFSIQNLTLTLDQNGEPVEVSVRRRTVSEQQTLELLFDEAIAALRQSHPQMRIIRKRECLLAGSPALALDYRFNVGHSDHHGRFVAGLVPHAGGIAPQWLSIGCKVDPNSEALSQWLLQFDQMLDGLAGV
ncbi:hypothetical protein [Pseudomonas graminis]|uniref:hypothetical protein n=1 Tax=Pseudomonas graminis TaxID=158627 RepID=UPI001FC9AB21|nr:hypothetical protein [Pseudomonas graminis]